MQIMQMHILQVRCYAKNAILFCINTRKPRRNDAHAQRVERRTKTLRNQTKNSPNANTRIKSNNEQKKLKHCNSLKHNNLSKCNFCIIIFANACFAMQKMQMQILHPICTMYMIMNMYMITVVYREGDTSPPPVPQQSTARHYRQDLRKHE